MASKTRVKVLLVSTLGTGASYTVCKNSRKPKMSLRKFDFYARKHAVFVEKKLVYSS